MRKTSNRQLRLLMVSKDWAYTQYFSSLIHKVYPDALIKTVSGLRKDAFDSSGDLFDMIVFDSCDSVDDSTAFYQDVYKKSKTEIFLLDDVKPEIQDAPKKHIRSIKRPRTHKEVVEFINRSVKHRN